MLDATDQKVADISPMTPREYNALMEECVRQQMNKMPNKSEYEVRRALAGEPPHILNALIS